MFTRVLIVDDKPRARRSLKALLTAIHWSASERAGQPNLARLYPVEVVGEAEDGPQAVVQVATLLPDVVVMDLQPHSEFATGPRQDGMATIKTIKSIKSGWPATKVVVLTMYATNRTSILAAGADAFLLKGCPTGELLEVVMSRESTNHS